MIYSSFDIFDTCLVRTCGTPENFFDILSTRVFDEPVPENIRQSFIFARRDEESKKYQESPFTNIFDIYKDFSFPHPAIKKNEELLNLELELEKEVIVPVQKTVETINSLREKGHQILFISDMYLIHDFINELLTKYDIIKPGDKLFVSSNVGHSKFDGGLFRYIHETENIPYKKWTHYGDNVYGDYRVPKSLGIKAVRIELSYTTYEKEWIKKQSLAIFKTNNLVAGLSRSVNLSNPEHPRKKLLIDVIAPFYCSFASFIFNDARKRGITRLFFCARDTYQLYQVAQVINQKYPEISVHYLRISRKVLQKETQENILGYFCQEGLASTTDKTAIVDNTSAGTTIHFINNILDSNGYNKTFGYFFIKHGNSAWKIDPNLFYGVIYRDYILKNNQYEPLFRVYILFIMEHIFSVNTQQMTIGYRKNNETYSPVYDDDPKEEESSIINASFLQQYHTELLTQYAKRFIDLDLNIHANHILHNIAIPTLISFFNYPIKEYSESLQNCYLRLHGKTLPYIKKESLFQLLITKGRDTHWLRGTVFISFPNWIMPALTIIISHKMKRI